MVEKIRFRCVLESFYLTLEECKLRNHEDYEFYKKSFYLTLEECKLVSRAWMIWSMHCFYLTLEECKSRFNST